MKNKIKLSLPVIVEGKYDKIKLSNIIDAEIIQTDGFGIFNSKEKLALIKRLSSNGIILLCDSDGAGGVIRRHIKGAIPRDKIYDLYIPKIEGKEKRKREKSKEGTLGVEGIDDETLRRLFEAFTEAHPQNGEIKVGNITKADFFEVGMTGAPESTSRRDKMALYYSLPDKMTPTALLGALNMIIDKEEFYITAAKLFDTED